MANVTRMCPQCGHGNDLDTRYCAQCGYDTQGNLPAPQQSNLPAVIGKAAPSGKTARRKPAAALSEAFDVAESSAANHSPPDGPADAGTRSTLH